MSDSLPSSAPVNTENTSSRTSDTVPAVIGALPPSSNSDQQQVVIEAASEQRIGDIASISNYFLNGKHCCCLVPLGSCDGVDDYKKKYAKHPDLYSVGAIAVDTSTGEALGCMQLVMYGMPCDMHTVKKDECYIDWIAVLPNATRPA